MTLNRHFWERLYEITSGKLHHISKSFVVIYGEARRRVKGATNSLLSAAFFRPKLLVMNVALDSIMSCGVFFITFLTQSELTFICLRRFIKMFFLFFLLFRLNLKYLLRRLSDNLSTHDESRWIRDESLSLGSFSLLNGCLRRSDHSSCTVVNT